MIKLKNILKEVIGFDIPGSPRPKFLDRATRIEFSKFFNNFQEKTTTAISNYADKIMASNSPEETKKEASQILNDLEEISIDIQDELENRQIGDNELSQSLFNYVNSEIDPDEATPFEQILWYDNQIVKSIDSEMVDNAVAILDQLREQLEFIRGFILQEFPEKPLIGFK